MNILISGGWGYGNLGDDAILISTIELILSKYPDANIKIFSYSDVDTSRLFHKKNIECYNSIHKIVYGNSAYRFLSIRNKSFNYHALPYPLKGILLRLSNFISLKKDSRRTDDLKKSKKFSKIDKLFKTADLFIMSGGGYFNNWTESCLSHMQEIKLAKKYKVKTVLAGLTLDDFNEYLKDDVMEYVSYANAIALRDTNSIAVLNSYGIKASLIPDLALSGLWFKHNISKKRQITLIPAVSPYKTKEKILEGIISIAKSNNLHVKVALTRLYNSDIIEAKWFYKKLLKHGVDSSFRIPNSFNDIVEDIVYSDVVISRNLHGLIIGYVSESKIISLNDGWKFKGFMSQVNQEDSLLKESDLNCENIIKVFSKIYSSDFDYDTKLRISNQVIENFNKLII